MAQTKVTLHMRFLLVIPRVGGVALCAVGRERWLTVAARWGGWHSRSWKVRA